MRVRVRAHLPRLHGLGRLALEVGRVSKDGALDRAVLSDNHADGHASETAAASDNRLGPPRESLDKGALVEQTAEPLAVADEQLARVEGRARGRVVTNLALDGVDDRQARQRRAHLPRGAAGGEGRVRAELEGGW